ncbi:MAG: ABC transporter permease [Alphaproteobacteria bacterium]|nr:ABC transporter permease [Alphaproteobacteria bacterium]
MSRAGDALARHAGLVGVVAFLGLWELAARLGWRNPAIMPAPSQAVVAALATIPPWTLLEHVATSLWRICAGFALGAAAGIGLGIAAGWYRPVALVSRPFVEILRPIPPLAWIPIAIVWFGLGEPSKIFVIFLGTFFPVFTSAARGMASIQPAILRAARTMDVDGLRLLAKVAIPAAMPDIATGLRIGFGLGFGVLVAAELIAAERGMGHLVMEARQLGQLGVSVFGIFLIGLVNLVADHQLAAAIRRTVGRWHEF